MLGEDDELQDFHLHGPSGGELPRVVGVAPGAKAIPLKARLNKGELPGVPSPGVISCENWGKY